MYDDHYENNISDGNDMIIVITLLGKLVKHVIENI